MGAASGNIKSHAWTFCPIWLLKIYWKLLV